MRTPTIPAAYHGPKGQRLFTAQAQGQQIRHLRQKGHQPFAGAGDELEPARSQELLGQGEVIGERIGVCRRGYPFQYVEKQCHSDGAQQGAPDPIRRYRRPAARRNAAQKDHAGRRRQAKDKHLGPPDMAERGGKENQPSDRPETGGETPRDPLAAAEIPEHPGAGEHRRPGPKAGCEEQRYRAQRRHVGHLPASRSRATGGAPAPAAH